MPCTAAFAEGVSSSRGSRLRRWTAGAATRLQLLQLGCRLRPRPVPATVLRADIGGAAGEGALVMEVEGWPARAHVRHQRHRSSRHTAP
jgi:hypothetical protein